MLLTGGGTGGHLFPAIASAQKLLEMRPGSEVLFVGTRRKMDRTSLTKYDFANQAIHSYGLKGKSLFEVIKALGILPLSCLESLVILLRFKPDVVLGVGGYVTGPVVATAKILGIPTLIHEQNSVPGLANRKLGSLVDRVCISLPDSGNLFPAKKIVLTGNPVRKEIIDVSQKTRELEKGLTILVLGGSQGAHGVNMLVADALTNILVPEGLDITVIHQTGAQDEEPVREKYSQHGVQAEVSAFFQNMAELYAKADLVVSRAGATTLSELAVMGKAAILIPYPTAADNHQQKNAEYYAGDGGAVIQVEKKTTAEQLADQIRILYHDHEKRTTMAAVMKKLGIPEAAERIVESCLALVK